MNRNIIIGIGLVGAGFFLAQRAKSQGKIVPIIGGIVSSGAKRPVVAPTHGSPSNFSGYDRISREWDY